MSAIDYEAQYNNSRRVPEVDQIGHRWRAASKEYRAAAHAEVDQPYGPGERHRYDLFPADRRDAPMVLYFHGGYWQEGDRTLYSFLAEPLNKSGLGVVIPSYSLCPAVSVLEIVDELRSCMAAVWNRTGVRPLVVGHSAGGHLTAAMLATDWAAVGGVPSDLVRGGVAISGVFELQPLVSTSINAALGLDQDSARAGSPLFWPIPPGDRALVAVVGGQESAEFRRQGREMAEHWRAAGLRSEYIEIPGANHFTVVDKLATPGTALFSRVVALARELHGPT
ncbi:MAG: alpha/beta hydrolase [Actinomycetota bacterium]|nr:alpha/beta hydrolase [Actinomycetota bacterium]